MRRISLAGLLLSGLWLPTRAWADGPRKAAAADEIDAQLAKLAAPPPEVEIRFDPLTDKRYTLLSGSFELDDEALPFNVYNPTYPLFNGKLAPGTHRVSAKLAYKEAQGSGIFEYADYKLTILSSVKILAQKGLRSHVHLGVDVHPEAPQKQRLAVASHVESEMLAQIDDAPVPDEAKPASPPPPPTVVAAAEPAPSKTSAAEPAREPGASEHVVASGRHKARHALAPVDAAATAPAPPPAVPAPPPPPAPPMDAGASVAPPPVAAVPPPSPVAPLDAPGGQDDDDLRREILGFCMLGAGILVAGIAWLVGRRKR